MAIRISKAKISDVREIRRLEEKVWKEKNVSSRYDIANLVRFGYVFVAKQNGKIIGAVMAYRTRDNCVYVADWFVDKKFRGKGIGTRLYRRLFAAVRLPLVTLIHPNWKNSRALHESMGFKVMKKIKDPYGLGSSEYRFFVKKK